MAFFQRVTSLYIIRTLIYTVYFLFTMQDAWIQKKVRIYKLSFHLNSTPRQIHKELTKTNHDKEISCIIHSKQEELEPKFSPKGLRSKHIFLYGSFEYVKIIQTLYVTNRRICSPLSLFDKTRVFADPQGRRVHG